MSNYNKIDQTSISFWADRIDKRINLSLRDKETKIITEMNKRHAFLVSPTFYRMSKQEKRKREDLAYNYLLDIWT